MEAFKHTLRRLVSFRTPQMRLFSEGRPNEPTIPEYEHRKDESAVIRKARLLYQSRKRGMLENDLILSTFADKYLQKMDGELLEQYDKLINVPLNDWDIYYWATGIRDVPPEYDNKVMALLKDHVLNTKKESRIRQPDLPHEI
ncbi:succinate dehydrogenase assembly factor 2-A, mitochondrial-like [Cimex lectularius]|uniref:Succinate dehydrogenase assembly factor 2, mitochondrial n=1 Tax=Cimex lectularius TaxID=79782 RepID=A0A8I6RAT9_CIMLE|nr:succinate dehydrogenase assembly factor 2-A, mitochondrial-like [Cimex lectularius]